MLDVKQLTYTILSELELPFEDTPKLERREYPYGLFRLNDQQIIRFKNYKQVVWNFKIDIFSTYSGDKECLNWFNIIEDLVYRTLMAHQEIVHVDTSGFVLDDKEQGPVSKHGVFTIKVTTREELLA